MSSLNNYNTRIQLPKPETKKIWRSWERLEVKDVRFEHVKYAFLENPTKYSIKMFQDTGQLRISCPKYLEVP